MSRLLTKRYYIDLKQTALWSKLTTTLLLLAFGNDVLHADIRTDGSVGPLQTLKGPNFVIPQTLGQLAGGNLFHSFQQFSIASGESATFMTTSPAINNVISRVTGGQISTIDGLLKLTPAQGASPSLFLINPSGIVFGQNSIIDVPGSFYASTSDYLQFRNGRWYANVSKESSFSSEAPEAFGFLGERSSSIHLKENAWLTPGGKGKISLTAGDIEIGGGWIESGSGGVDLVAVGKTVTEVPMNLQNQPASSLQGKISVSSNAVVSTSSDNPYFSEGNSNDAPPSRISIRAGFMTVDGESTAITSDSYTSAPAGVVDIDLSHNLTLTNGGLISANNFASGNGGEVLIRAGSVLIDGLNNRASQIQCNIYAGGGASGLVHLDIADDIKISEGGMISANTYGSSHAGALNITAENIFLDGVGSGIYNLAGYGSSGNAGYMSVEAAGLISMTNGAQLISTTFETGNAGMISVKSGSMRIASQAAIGATGIFSTAYPGSSGMAGDIRIQVKDMLTLTEAGLINSSTYTHGQAGRVIVEAGAMLVDGRGYSGFTGVASQAGGGSGPAGGVELQIGNTLTLRNGAQISSSTLTDGKAGTVKVAADRILIDGEGFNGLTGITSNAEAGSGNAGSVDVQASHQIKITNGGEIGSNTFSHGQAGQVYVKTTDLMIDGQGQFKLTGIASNAQDGSGNAGSVEIQANTIKLENRGSIASNTFTSGDAGKVNVSAASIIIDAHGVPGATAISSDALESSHGQAGEVHVTASDELQILHGGKISSSVYSSGNGKQIDVMAGRLVIDGSETSQITGIFSNAESGTGSAGKVQVTADSIAIEKGGQISSNTFSSGNAGGVEIRARELTADPKLSTDFTGIASQASGTTGNAGHINIQVTEDLSLTNGGSISSSTFSDGAAGAVDIQAGTMVLDGRDSPRITEISSNAEAGTGNAGTVDVFVAKDLSISRGAQIGSSTLTSGNAGTLNIHALNMFIDGLDSSKFTGIASQSLDSTGNAGQINISVPGSLVLKNQGKIDSSTFSQGKAGAVSVNAGDINLLVGGQLSSNTFSSANAGKIFVLANSLHIDAEGQETFTGISSRSTAGTSGNAGQIDVAVLGTMEVLNGGGISSSTFSNGSAGAVNVSAGHLVIDGFNHPLGAEISSNAEAGRGNAGPIQIDVAGNLSILRSGNISSNTFTEGDAGKITINAGSLDISTSGTDKFTGIASQASGTTGRAGEIDVKVAGDLRIENGGSISSSTFSDGNAGSVSVLAHHIVLDGGANGVLTEISSNTEGGEGGLKGNAGTVDIRAKGDLTLLNRAEIGSNTYSEGHAGHVKIQAEHLEINGKGMTGFTGIASNAAGTAGNAGKIEINVSGETAIRSGGAISSTTYSLGNSGSVEIQSQNMVIDGKESDEFTGISTNSTGGSGKAGEVTVLIKEKLSVLQGGEIASNTFSDHDAGQVSVKAKNIYIDSQESSRFTGIASDSAGTDLSLGNAGHVLVEANQSLLISNGGMISSSTYTQGNAGSVTVKGRDIHIDGAESLYETGIASDAAGGTGHAGQVTVNALNSLTLVRGGIIGSSTFTAGRAGIVAIEADSMHVDGREGIYATGVFASAESGSSGQTGDISVQINDRLELLGGVLSIRNDGAAESPDAIVPSRLTISAGEVNLGSNGGITASSSGNIAASQVFLEVKRLLRMADSSISTSSYNGDGGPITIRTSGMSVRQSEITTSVHGQNGNGGNIAILADTLALDSGFIQANTAAQQASGGKVGINIKALISSGNTLFLGGNTPFIFSPEIFAFNVIQAAAPDGVSGSVTVTAPDLDLSGALAALSTKMLDKERLAQNPCETPQGSSFSLVGRGGLPLSIRGLLHADPIGANAVPTTHPEPGIGDPSSPCLKTNDRILR